MITVDGKQKRVVKYFVDVPWDIGEFTDSLQTNLDIKEIKKLYPKFSGFYQKVQPDSIVVRYDSTFYSPFILGNPMIYINGVKDRQLKSNCGYQPIITLSCIVNLIYIM